MMSFQEIESTKKNMSCNPTCFKQFQQLTPCKDKQISSSSGLAWSPKFSSKWAKTSRWLWWWLASGKRMNSETVLPLLTLQILWEKNMGKPCCNVHYLKVTTAHQRCSQVGVLADCIWPWWLCGWSNASFCIYPKNHGISSSWWFLKKIREPCFFSRVKPLYFGGSKGS